MDTLYKLSVVAHLLGLAALVGGYFTVFLQAAPRPPAVMVWGARLQVLTGLVIVGLGEGAGVWTGEPNHAKIGAKLAIALAVVALVEIASARSRSGTQPPSVRTLVHAAGGLAIVNVLIAVFVKGFVG